jgi:hypothetical protein
VRPKAFQKASFRYNQSFDKEMYAIGENDAFSYKRKFVITEFFINGFNCIRYSHLLQFKITKIIICLTYLFSSFNVLQYNKHVSLKE